MAKQHRLTYGLRRSPIRAAIQNIFSALVAEGQRVMLDTGAGGRRNGDLVGPDIPVFVPVHQRREDVVRVRARADEKQYDQ